MTELLFNTTILTDMGCTLRLFDARALRRIRPHLTIGGSHFGPQLLMEVVAHGIPFVEIPVNYRSRVGESSVTGSFSKAFRLGIQMIVLVLQYRVGVMKRERRLWKPEEGRTMREREQYADPSLANLARSVGVTAPPATARTRPEAVAVEHGQAALPGSFQHDHEVRRAG
jgi:hypothetical protein